jgi:hypothetical protein
MHRGLERPAYVTVAVSTMSRWCSSASFNRVSVKRSDAAGGDDHAVARFAETLLPNGNFACAERGRAFILAMINLASLMPRHVRPMAVERLSDLTSARLLAYRDKLLSLEESAEASDCAADELARLDAGLIYFKTDPRWEVLHASVVRELDARRSSEVG